MKRFFLVNTMNACQPGHIGRILSTHRSRYTAEKSDEKFQSAVKRHNSQNSYLPTVIVEAEVKRGIHPVDVYDFGDGCVAQ